MPVQPQQGETVAEHVDIIRLEATDSSLPKAWITGSMKYDHFEPFAEGGSASLEKCFDKNLQRTVLIKRLHPHLRTSEVEVKRFLREARVTGLISHPGTVPLYEIGRDRMGALYFTMKYIPGRDLRTILLDIAGQKPEGLAYPLPRLVDILIAACQTVAFAHTQGVIHRDLKPANILVGQFGEVIVLDWGLAKVHGDYEDDVQEVAVGKRALALELTQPGKRYGTPLYMSPEQAKADAELDERTDVYNLGSILFEMLSHKNLVWGNDVSEVLEQILERPTPTPSELSPDLNIPAELEAVCLKALAKDPRERYQNVNSFMTDLIRYRDGEAVKSYHYSRIEQWLRWQTKNTFVTVGFLSAVLGALLMFIAMALLNA